MTYGELAAQVDGPLSAPLLTEARTLAAIEKSLRSAVLYAVMLLKHGQFADAEAQLRAALKAHGPNSAIFINLAKLAVKQGRVDEGLALGHQALGLEPNDEVALGWYSSAMRVAGKQAQLLEQLARLGGFRPQVQLAEYHLEHRDAQQAGVAFEAALTAAKDGRECVEVVTRDLRATDQHALLVQLLASRYRLEVHGPYVGLALARAQALSGQRAAAEALLAQVRPQVRPDAAKFVAELEALLVTERVEAAGPQPRALRSVALVGPVWAAPLMAAGLELPSAPLARLIGITQFADCTQDRPVALAGPVLEASSEVENACRAIPLWLAEALSLTTSGAGVALISTEGQSGLASYREPLRLESALLLAPPRPLPRVLVTGFFSRAITTELQLDVFVHDLVSGAPPTQLRLSKGSLQTLAARAERDLKATLFRLGILSEKPPSFTRPPEPGPGYLEVLHHVLVMVLASTGRVDRALMWGTGPALTAAAQLAERSAPLDTPALLLAAAFAAMREESFRDTVEGLLRPFAWAKTLKL